MASNEVKMRVRVQMDTEHSLDLPGARLAVWREAGFPASTIEPSLDVLTLALAAGLRDATTALAALTADLQTTQAALAALRIEFDRLAARERIEHRPVSGSIRFIGGRPVRGVVSFTASANP